MLGIEYENFKKLNKQEYIVKKNPKFLSQYREMKKKKFYTILDLDEIQDLINRITYFYEFKYPSNMLNRVDWSSLADDPELASCIQLSRLLDMKQLQYRLHHDQLRFLECSYGGMIALSKKTDLCYHVEVKIDSVGKIDEIDLTYLKECELLDDIQGIESAEDLYKVCQRYSQMIDYQDLERHIHNHKDNISLRNETLNLTMLSLLYANGDLPFGGYIRAKSFMRMFNKEYDANLNMSRLDDIMSIEYKNTKEVKRLLKARR